MHSAKMILFFLIQFTRLPDWLVNLKSGRITHTHIKSRHVKMKFTFCCCCTLQRACWLLSECWHRTTTWLWGVGHFYIHIMQSLSCCRLFCWIHSRSEFILCLSVWFVVNSIPIISSELHECVALNYIHGRACKFEVWNLTFRKKNPKIIFSTFCFLLSTRGVFYLETFSGFPYGKNAL
jgi:hypothetical protein